MGDGLTTHDSAAHGCRAGFRKSEDMRRFIGRQQTLSRGQIGDRQARDDRGGAGFCRQIRVPLVMIVSWVHRTGAQDQRRCRHESQANGHHDGSLFNPTFAIRASGRANPLSFRGVDSQGRHYSEFAEAEFWTSPKRRIGGGGCWGKVSFSCCSSSCWSASGWVYRGRIRWRPSVVGRCTSTI